MRMYRQALHTVVEGSLDVQYGVAGNDAIAYRRCATTVFMGVGIRRRVVQATLGMLPNGDWRLQEMGIQGDMSRSTRRPTRLADFPAVALW